MIFVWKMGSSNGIISHISIVLYLLSILILPIFYRFETSAKEDTCITEAAKYLVNTIVQLETEDSSESGYEIDYTSSSSSSTITLNDQTTRQNNKSDTSKCCT
jgi:hypothetical protein